MVYLLPAGSLHGQPEPDPEEPPVAGQPANFNGAVGVYKIAATAEPTELQAEDPLTFTVRISGSGSPRHPPRRLPLRRWPQFVRRFEVEDLPDSQPAAGAWEFRYRLKPLSSAVKEIPSLRFDYFTPGAVPREKGYRSTYAPAIALKVRPRAELQPAEVQATREPAALPETLYDVTDDPALVLRHDEPFALPGLAPVAVAILVPPVLCAAWYAAWRYRYPDAVRLARRRQSRAARQALQALATAGRDGPDARAFRVAAIVAEYLQQRWELAAVEPTPRDVASHLKGRRCPDALSGQAAAFLRACDTARFAPEGEIGDTDLTAAAARLIATLEDDACP
jgi:hypothetical protein